MESNHETANKILIYERNKSFTFFVAGSSILIIRFVFYLVHLLFIYVFNFYFDNNEMIVMIISFVLIVPTIVGLFLFGVGLNHLKKEEKFKGSKAKLNKIGQIFSFTTIIWKAFAINFMLFGFEPIAQKLGYYINIESTIDSVIFASLLMDVILMTIITTVISQQTKDIYKKNKIKRLVAPFVLIFIIAALIIEIIFAIVLKIRIPSSFNIFELVTIKPVLVLQITFITINILYSIISLTACTEFLIKQYKQIQEYEAK